MTAKLCGGGGCPTFYETPTELLVQGYIVDRDGLSVTVSMPRSFADSSGYDLPFEMNGEDVHLSGVPVESAPIEIPQGEALIALAKSS
jgi:hypothetical protein